MKSFVAILLLVLLSTSMALIGLGFSELISHVPSSLTPADYFSGGMALAFVSAMLHGVFIK
jgi:hypothetical protein